MSRRHFLKRAVTRVGLVRDLVNLFSILQAEHKRALVLLLGVMVAQAGIQLGFVGSLPMAVKVLQNPETIEQVRVVRATRDALGVGDLSSRGFAVTFVVAIFLLSVVGNLCVTFYTSQVNRRLVQDIGERLFGAYICAPYVFHLRMNSAQLVRNLNQEVNRTSKCFLSLVQLFMNCLSLILLFGLLVWQEPIAAMIAMGVNSGAGLGIFALLRRGERRLGERLREQQGRVIQIISQAITAIKETRVLGRQRHFFDQYSASLRVLNTAKQRHQMINAVIRPLMMLVGFASLGMVIAMLYVKQGSLEPILPIVALFAGAFMRIMPQATAGLQALTDLYFRSVSATAVARDLHDLGKGESMGLAGGLWDGGGALRFQDRIQVDDVWFSYPAGAKTALRGASLTIKRGETVGFVGATGSGKSTMVDIIMGILEPQAGTVRMDGIDVHREIEAWNGLLGVVQQEIYILDETVRANVAFGLPEFEVDDQQVWAALESAHIASKVRALDGQLDAELGENGVSLSGGERQRIGLARAIFGDPQVLILDEATSSLDNETERSIMESIYHIRKQRTALIIGHRLTTVQDCDRIYVFDDGAVAAHGSYEQLVQGSPLFRKLANLEQQAMSGCAGTEKADG